MNQSICFRINGYMKDRELPVFATGTGVHANYTIPKGLEKA